MFKEKDKEAYNFKEFIKTYLDIEYEEGEADHKMEKVM
jgi:hypothetical protein